MKHRMLVLGLCLLAGCFNREESRTNLHPKSLLVVTSTQELRLLLEPVVGANVKVEALVSTKSDGHEFEYSSKHLLLLKNADYVVGNGMRLDNDWLTKGLRAAGKGLSKDLVFWMSDCVKDPIESHDHEKRNHVHSGGNPHWIFDPGLPPELWACLAAALPVEKSVLLDGSLIKSASEKFNRQVESLRSRLAPLKGLRVVSLHRNLSYFLKRFGVVEVVLEGVNEVEQIRPALLKDLEGLYKKKQIDAILVTSEMNPRLATQIRQHMPELRILQVNINDPQLGYPPSLESIYERMTDGFLSKN